MADAYGQETEKEGADVAPSSTALNGISGGDLGASASIQQLIFDEFVAPFDAGHMDDVFVSYLFPDSEDFPGTGHDANWHMGWQGCDVSTPFATPHAPDPFSPLVDSLTHFTLSLPEGHPERALNDRLARASALFSKKNVERFIGHYFRDYSPHSPILVPGTFRISSASPYVLIVIIVTGAMFSSSPGDIELARGILELVELYVFSNENFVKLLQAPYHAQYTNDVGAWDALQAAFFITQIQLREGSLAKRKEARTARFEEIISGVHAFGLLQTRNPFFHAEPPLPETFQWDQYGDSETKIRLVCGVFNLDASFTILYNMTPRLFAEEVEVDMPCPAEAFFADSAQDCYQVSLKEHGIQTLHLSELCNAFLQDTWSEQQRTSMLSLSLLHLFTLILALLQTLWLSPYRPRKWQLMQRMAVALERWRDVWDFQNTKLTPRQRERFGFLKTAPLEFWQIASVLVKKKATRLDRAVDQSNLYAANNGRYGSCLQCAQDLLQKVDKEQA
ncbi:hypothetical protein G647_07793 [Cladophialophora carrionii CBS 160.54]|uniref:Xylanolytic transcriptional activator regulatory domain-containing protein n=1 Tax=Cladophialophora carrionii CBS 160.54 TaxID=1279043 RepID=V9D477_9EURO|nr:uncharacterized protein G647_07793 [Cladophialophora carrionii CBS 160.54]ETI21446.1 hypothetical protein G647_07793 [Cladophialophora carrionii CBS 160.54]